jgi:hypothetical protein
MRVIATNNDKNSIQNWRAAIFFAIKSGGLAALYGGVKVLLIALLIGNLALAQTRKGTIGVIYYTEDKIAAAIDSRAIAEIGPASDLECKVATIDKQVLVMLAGVEVHTDATRNVNWSGMEEARRAYKTISSQETPAEGRTAQTAAWWASVMLTNVTEWNGVSPSAVRANVENGTLIRAFFGGRDQKGSLVLWQVRITYESARMNPLDRIVEKISCINDICALGRVDLVAELTQTDSQRAHAEALEWERIADTIPLEDRPIRKAMRLVNLTIQERHSRNLLDVGKPIDAVEMKRDGTVRWYERKQNCPEN